MHIGRLPGVHHIQCYCFFQYHRSAITEGIRKLAFRNMRNLRRCMQAVGVAELACRESANMVLDRMLEEQDLERTKTNRRLQEYSVVTTWEVYLCLLYAELECYQEVSRKHPELTYARLNALLARHGRYVASLKRFRNRVLHPKTAKATAAAREHLRASIGRHAIEAELVTKAQREVDTFLKWMQDTWRERGTAAVRELELVNEAQLTGRHLAVLTLLEEGLPVMQRPLPVLPDVDKDAGDHRHPLFPNGIRRWSEELLAERPWEFAGQVPAFARNAAFGISFMLLGSELIVDQTMGAIDLKKLKTVENPFEHDPTEFVRLNDVPSTGQEWLDQVAPMRVRAAMMAEPVRMYREVTGKCPNLRDDRIETVLEDDDLCSALAGFRNLMFHVMPKDGPDPDSIESRFTRWVDYRQGVDNPDPIGALGRLLNAFYFRVGGARAPSFIELERAETVK